MKKSFVFHEDYMTGIPESDKAEFTLCIVEFALYGKMPDFTGDPYKMALFMTFAERVSDERARYAMICEKRREAARRRYRSAAKETPPENDTATERAASANSATTAAAKNTAESAGKKQRFIKPTVAEVAAYCAERKNVIDAAQFVDFYDSKGWKIGANSMKDWKAAIRTWEQRHKANPPAKAAGAMWGNENSVPDEYMALL